MNTWLPYAILTVNCFTIAISMTSSIRGHAQHKRIMRGFLRDGVQSGKLARYLQLTIPDEYLDDPKAMKSVFVKGFVHGYMSTGRRMAREMQS